jgi:hypothetical protein
MGGGSGSPAPVQDDFRVKSGEKLWRLVHDGWYQPDALGKRSVQEAAFVGEVSLLRQTLVSQQDVDVVKNGQFAGFGIAELEANEIRGNAGCFLRITPDADWPAEAHVLVIRKNGSKRLRATHPEVRELTKLANSRPLLRDPRP